MIVKNIARCRKCKDEVESVDMNEIVYCKCKALGVGGVNGKKGYLYRKGLQFDELSEHERINKPLQWPW